MHLISASQWEKQQEENVKSDSQEETMRDLSSNWARLLSVIHMPVDIMIKLMSPIYEILAAQTSKRFIKTHLPMKLMPKNIKEVGAKVVYVARNPKDVVVSYYHFSKTFPGFKFTGDFETFLNYFMNDLCKFF